MIKGSKKEDLRLLAIEIGETITDKLTIIELTNIITNHERYIKEPDFITGILNGIIEDRKVEEQRKLELKKRELELEKIKLKKNNVELALARLRVESVKVNETESQVEKCDSLDSLASDFNS